MRGCFGGWPCNIVFIKWCSVWISGVITGRYELETMLLVQQMSQWFYGLGMDTDRKDLTQG